MMYYTSVLEFSNPQILDISSLRWGAPPVPLLPRSLREAWRDEPLPSWLIGDCSLPEASTVQVLGPNYWDGRTTVSPRLQHFVEFIVRTRARAITDLLVFQTPWPAGLELEQIPLSARAANALSSSGLARDKNALANVTFGDLLAIPGLGIKSLIEIATVMEAALDTHWCVTAGLAKSFASAEVRETQPTESSEDSARTQATSLADDWKEALTTALQYPWIDHVDEHDPRFAKHLPPGYGTLEDRIDRAISDPAEYSSDIPRLVESLPRLKAEIDRMAAQPLESSLLELLSTFLGPEEPRLTTLAARLGWLGDDPKTLQECGDMLGVSRERVRQIEARLIGKLTAYPLYLPSLDTALSVLESAAPAHVSRAATLLMESGVCRRPFSPVALIETAKLLGRNTSLAVEEIRGERVVVVGEQGQTLGVLVRTARRLAGQSGVSSVYKVVDELAEAVAPLDPPDIDEDAVRRILRDQSAYEFLDDDWFWHTEIPEGRNRLENITKKILSVASPQTVASIREGVRRVFQWRSSTNERFRGLVVPPQSVLAKFFERHPDFQVEGDLVNSVKPLDYRTLLGEGEQILVDVLRSASSGVLDRQSLVRECLARGVNENTLAVYTTYSAVLVHLGVGLWQLRGVRVDPAAVEAVRQQNALRARETRVQDFGWTHDGKLWVAWVLPFISGSPVFGIPAPIKRFLANRSFEVRPKEVDRAIGRISITEHGTSYGYAPFFRYSGADEGDRLRAEFDLAGATVQLSINEETEEDGA